MPVSTTIPAPIYDERVYLDLTTEPPTMVVRRVRRRIPLGEISVQEANSRPPRNRRRRRRRANDENAFIPETNTSNPTPPIRRSAAPSAQDFEGMGFIDTAKNFIFGRRDLPPSVKKFLHQHGNEVISSIEVNRQPIRRALLAVLNLLSKGKINENMRALNYDKLFHLRMNIRTVNGTYFGLEKNEVVVVTKNPKNTSDSESINIKRIPNGLTTISMFEKAKAAIGEDSLFSYSAKEHNCQHFVSSILRANGMGSPDVMRFIQQDMEALFKDTGFLRKIANTTTDFASRLDVLRQGGAVDHDPGYLLRREKLLNGGGMRM